MNVEIPSLIRILLVDENENALLDFQRSFRKNKVPCEIIQCTCVEDALKYMHEPDSAFDVVVSDYVLPDRSGLELFNDLRSSGTNVPFTLINGNDSKQIESEAVKNGVDEYIIKDSNNGYLELLPITITELLQKYDAWQPKTKENENVKKYRNYLDRHFKKRMTKLMGMNRQLSKELKELKYGEERRIRAIDEQAAVIDSMVDGLVLINSNGEISNVNPALEKMCGIEKRNLIGINSYDFFSALIKPKDMEKMIKVFNNSFEGKITPKTFTLSSETGKQIPVEVNASYLRDSEGNPTSIIGVFRGITERKHAEDKLKESLEKLESSNKELEQFAYVASHDLQEPLRKIRSFTEILAEQNRDKFDDKAQKYMDYIVNGTTRMQGLINDLLTYSRISIGVKQFELTKVKSVIDEVLDNIQVAVKESSATITYDNLPNIKAECGQLAQVFQNLISNAIKFSGANIPKIHISAKENDNEWLFAVRDNGIGIEPEHHERIFLIFQRLHMEDDYPGTGIGLAVCKKIIERHGGRIWLESEPGIGSTFYFTIQKNLNSDELRGNNKPHIDLPSKNITGDKIES